MCGDESPCAPQGRTHRFVFKLQIKKNLSLFSQSLVLSLPIRSLVFWVAVSCAKQPCSDIPWCRPLLESEIEEDWMLTTQQSKQTEEGQRNKTNYFKNNREKFPGYLRAACKVPLYVLMVCQQNLMFNNSKQRTDVDPSQIMVFAGIKRSSSKSKLLVLPNDFSD